MSQEYTFHSFPQPIGWWVLPGSDDRYKTKFSVVKKPRWLTIKLMFLLLQWGYEDESN